MFVERRFMEPVMTEPGAERPSQMIGVIAQAVRFILQGYRWASACQRCGIRADQAAVSSRVLRRLSYERGLPVVSAGRPSADLLRLCWPRNKIFDEELIMGLLPGGAVACHPAATNGTYHAADSSQYRRTSSTYLGGFSSGSACTCAQAQASNQDAVDVRNAICHLNTHARNYDVWLAVPVFGT